MKWAYSIATVFFIVITIFTIVYNCPNVYQTKSTEQDVHVSNILSYLHTDEQIANQTLQLMSEREIIHMKDVKLLFNILNLLFAVSVWIIIVGILTQGRKNILLWTHKACRSAVLIIIIIAALTGAFFRQVFFAFHELVFFNDYWILPYDSLLIQTFPEATFARIVMITLISSILVLMATTLGIQHYDRHQEQRARTD